MIVKLFEVRDAGTFLPMVAIKLGGRNLQESYLLSRTGYGMEQESQSKYVLLADLYGGELTYDQFKQPNRTRQTAHSYIIKNFDNLESGSVIDVEFILGETKEPKLSEKLTY